MKPREEYYEKQAQVIINNLKRRNRAGYYCKDISEAKEKLAELLGENKTIGYGGSMTIDENGFKDFLREKGHEIIVRDDYKTPEEKRELNKKLITCDAFLSSTNAISMDGELVNIDGASSRVAFITYGPEEVYIITGMNKVTSDLETAMERAKNVAAPINAIRIGTGTPCTKAGKCMDCFDSKTICCNTVITRYSRIKDRIKVILIGEDLGY